MKDQMMRTLYEYVEFASNKKSKVNTDLDIINGNIEELKQNIKIRK